MKPAPFDLLQPASVEEAAAALAAHGDDAVVLAGGQSLVPLLNLRLARPAVVVDIVRVPGLDGIAAGPGAQGLVLGARVTQARALRSGEVGAAASLLAEALRHVGHPATRARGTVGGSAAHADPAAELPAVLLALDGALVLTGPGGAQRTVPAAEFFLGPFATARRGDELLTAVHLPAAPAGLRHGIHEVARRRGDFALAGAAVACAPGGHARVALFGVAPAPFRAAAAEAALAAGAPPAEVSALAAAAADPHDDVHATAAYRRRAAGVAVERAVAAALALASEARP